MDLYVSHLVPLGSINVLVLVKKFACFNCGYRKFLAEAFSHFFFNC